MSEEKRKVGRPLKFQSVEELQTKIDEYFNTTKREDLAWTGLALHLDVDRKTLYDYRERPEFYPTLKKALQRMELIYEQDLRNRSNPAGSIFALKNFDWSDRSEIKHDLSQGEVTQIKIIRTNGDNGGSES